MAINYAINKNHQQSMTYVMDTVGPPQIKGIFLWNRAKFLLINEIKEIITTVFMSFIKKI